MRNTLLGVSTFLGLLLAAAPGFASVWYVNLGNTSGVEDGLAWATALTAIQPAIEAAASGDEVWVAAGVYDEWRNAEDGALELREDVALYGGFLGGETSREARNPAENETVIDGAVSRLGEPAYHVVTTDATALLDGFTIRGGQATGSGSGRNSGGGMLIRGGAPEITDCRFVSNAALLGGALTTLNDGAPILTRVTFTGNAASSFGGATYSNADIAFTDCRFTGNSGYLCGGAAVYTGTARFSACVFDANVAVSRDGGAIWISSGGTVELDATRFDSNFAEQNGGAIAAWSGAVTARNCIFRANHAEEAGGAVYSLAVVELLNCTIWKNTAGTASAGIVNNGGALSMINCDLYGNTPAQILSLSAQPADVIFSNVQGGFSGEGNIDVVPAYRAPDSGDFRPFPGSPLIDQGCEIEGVTTDYRGLGRPRGAAFDIGAAEFFDADGDLMEDDWEAEYGLNPADPADGTADLDGDQASNAAEFALDTDPMDTNDPPRVFFVAPDGDDTAAGTSDAPFRTIGRATEQAEYFGNTLAIHLAAGAYAGTFDVPAGVTLQGAGATATRIEAPEGGAGEDAVVSLGAGATLQDCTLSYPAGSISAGLLAAVDEVSADIERVTFDGGDTLFSLGLRITGAASSETVVRACVFRRLRVALDVSGSAAAVVACTFDTIAGDAILVLPDARKQDASGTTPCLGDKERPDTGGNAFGNVSGRFIVNLTETAVEAENNDWGLDNPHAIESRLYGPVDFKPYISSKNRSILGCGDAPATRPTGDAVLAFLCLAGLLAYPRRTPFRHK